MKKHSAPADTRKYWSSVDFGIATIDDQPNKNFAPIKYKNIPPYVRSWSEYFIGQFLQKPAVPALARDLSVRCYVTGKPTGTDLIEFRWTFDNVPLRIVENANALQLDIPLGSDKPVPVEKLKPLVFKIIQMSGVDMAYSYLGSPGRHYSLQFQWPNVLTAGSQFTTNSAPVPFDMPNWHDRVDAFVHNNILSFIFYKRILNAVHPGFSASSGWLRVKTKR